MLSWQRVSWNGCEAGGQWRGAEGREQFYGAFPGPGAPVEALVFLGSSRSAGSFLKQTPGRPGGQAQGRHSPWDMLARRGSGTLGGQGGQRKQGCSRGRDGQVAIQICVTGDSLLPVILKLSASCTGEVLLNTGLLDGPWLKLISSILKSVQFP